MRLALKSDSHITSTEDELWQAVVAKDARYDGQFVFAVSSKKSTVDHRVLHGVLIATMLVFTHCRRRRSKLAFARA